MACQSRCLTIINLHPICADHYALGCGCKGLLIKVLRIHPRPAHLHGDCLKEFIFTNDPVSTSVSFASLLPFFTVPHLDLLALPRDCPSLIRRIAFRTKHSSKKEMSIPSNMDAAFPLALFLYQKALHSFPCFSVNDWLMAADDVVAFIGDRWIRPLGQIVMRRLLLEQAVTRIYFIAQNSHDHRYGMRLVINTI